MANAIQITIHGHKFLLPETHDNYAFPEYIEVHKEIIIKFIDVKNNILRLCSSPFSEEMRQAELRAKILRTDLAEFKAVTGIIGSPFDSRDVDLYVLVAT